jgi:hypothetical protein
VLEKKWGARLDFRLYARMFPEQNKKKYYVKSEEKKKKSKTFPVKGRGDL